MSKSNLSQRLRSHGINPTQQRLEIAELLLARDQHMSAEQVLKQVNVGQQALVSKATVYNTLGLFAEKGLLREVIVDSSKVFYDSNVMPHQHFFNVDSGEIVDIPPGELQLDAMPTLPDGTEMSGVDIVIRVQNKTKA